MARRKSKPIFRYKCTITDEEFKTTRKVENTEDLISVTAYYQLHPENDDRPDNIKKQLGELE